jgi:phospholipase C
VDRVVVMMLENHSFDNVLGMLPHRVPARADVDGLPLDASNPDPQGAAVSAFHLPDECPSAALTQSWDASHRAWDGGRNDGFVIAGGGRTPMGYFDERDLPVTYALASHFPISDRYFCSVLAQTYPNRRFLFCATASGTVSTTTDTFVVPAPNGTIFDRLDQAGISWHVYFREVPSPLIVPNFSTNPSQFARCLPFSTFVADARAGRLPQFTLVDPNYSYESEENPQDVSYGEIFMASVVDEIMRGPQWESTVLVITYDEHGGFYDHVPPPAAVPPDATPPNLSNPSEGSTPGAYDRYGFRVPLIVVSPWARRGYVSHAVADHTSILAFLEHRFGLEPLTARDAAAHDLGDMFDLSGPHLLDPPSLPAPPDIGASLARCRADGAHPPTAGSPTTIAPTP